MPYIRKGKCVYKRNTGKKVGCSKSVGKAKKYIRALHTNVHEVSEFDLLYRGIIKELHIH
jgi:hypothetical protein